MCKINHKQKCDRQKVAHMPVHYWSYTCLSAILIISINKNMESVIEKPTNYLKITIIFYHPYILPKFYFDIRRYFDVTMR